MESSKNVIRKAELQSRVEANSQQNLLSSNAKLKTALTNPKMNISSIKIESHLRGKRSQTLQGLKCFAPSKSNSQILLPIDNLTALAYINKMGGGGYKDQIDLHELTKELWEWFRIKENKYGFLPNMWHRKTTQRIQVSE